MGKNQTDSIGPTDIRCINNPSWLHICLSPFGKFDVLRANHGRDEAESWAGARANRDGGQETDGGGETAGCGWN